MIKSKSKISKETYKGKNMEKKAIVFLGVYTSDKRTDEIAEDVKDWGAFLNKYFFRSEKEAHSFLCMRPILSYSVNV